MKLHKFTMTVVGPEGWDAEMSVERNLKHYDRSFWIEDYVVEDCDHDWVVDSPVGFSYCQICDEQEEV